MVHDAFPHKIHSGFSTETSWKCIILCSVIYLFSKECAASVRGCHTYKHVHNIIIITELGNYWLVVQIIKISVGFLNCVRIGIKMGVNCWSREKWIAVLIGPCKNMMKSLVVSSGVRSDRN